LPNHKILKMENTTEKTTENLSPEYSIEWEDIEDTDLDYEYDLDEIENFFRKDYNEHINY
jgi:hypothetical protein